MSRRLAASVALIVFVVCLIAGAASGNSFATTVGRALLGMAATMVIGLLVGWMAERMLDENLRAEEEKLKNSATDAGATDR